MRVSRLAVAGAMLLLPACSRAQSAEPTPLGKETFALYCAKCHGAEGGGGLAPYEGAASPRNFRDHAFQASRTDIQIRETIVNGRPTGMPPFGATFDEAHMAALVTSRVTFPRLRA